LAQGRAEPTGARFGDLPLRLLSALVLGPIALACLWADVRIWATLVALAGIGVAAEWVRICRFRPLALPGAVLPVVVASAGLATAAGLGWAALAALAAGSVVLAAARSREAAARLWLAGGLLYVGLAAVATVWLRLGGSTGRGNVLFMVLIVWASDSGAYLVGRLLGGPKLAPRISPSKTWAGALGGLAFAVAAGLLVAAGFAAGPSAGVVLVSATLGVASQGGDLLESAIKRRFGVKHSGNLIPGHGGVLDRLDGVLAAAPAAAILVLALGPGVELWR
jgi:phosphatidate cytidylyltransferase